MKKELVKNDKDNNSKLGYIFIGGLIAITGISGAVLHSTIVSADDSSTDTLLIDVPISCTMSGNIDTAHNATLNNGTYSGASGSEYENGIGKTTLTTFCNDQNGFSIYAVGYTGNTIGNTDLVGTSVSGNATIPTGTNTSGPTSNWAMKVNKVTDSSTSYNPANMTITNSFDNYKAVPDEYTKVAEYHAGSGSSATDTILGAKVTTTYAAFISSTQIADTYSGQVKYVMVHPYDAVAPTDTLIMQDVSTWGSTVTAGQEVTAMDSRDNKTYTVARLADGNLWMTQNLDFDIVDGGADLDSTNTDVPSNWADAGNLTNTYATNDTSWYAVDEPYINPESYDPGDLCWNGTIRSDDSGTLANSTVACTSDRHYHIGNYYNWTAAVAMADSSSYTTQYTDVNQSICPAGWTLPKSGNITSSGSFAYLVNQAGLTSGTTGNIHTSPYYFVYGGLWNGIAGYGDSYGLYWSPTVSDDHYAYTLDFDCYVYLSPDNGGTRDDGRSVRCLAR